MLQSIFTQLGASSCSSSLGAAFCDFGTLTFVVIVVLSVLYKVLYEQTLLLNKGERPYVQSLSSDWFDSDSFNKFFCLMRDGFGAVSSLIAQLGRSHPKPIVLSGQEGRQIFFREKNLHLYETFQGLLGSVSTHEEIFYSLS
jgi:sterol 14-demethylase